MKQDECYCGGTLQRTMPLVCRKSIRPDYEHVCDRCGFKMFVPLWIPDGDPRREGITYTNVSLIEANFDQFQLTPEHARALARDLAEAAQKRDEREREPD